MSAEPKPATGTTMRISGANRDALMRVMADRPHATTLDEALRIVLWEWRGYAAIAATDPDDLVEYAAEATALAEATVADGMADLEPWREVDEPDLRPARAARRR